MGGVWDATNLVEGDVAVLTPIALDHPELGSTVREVAAEKVGIIKQGKIAVSREQDRGGARGDRVAVRDGRRGSALGVPGLGGGGAAAGAGWAIDAGARLPGPSTTTSSCRCSASTRRATPPPRSSAFEAFAGEALDEGTVAGGPRGRAVARPHGGRVASSHRDPGRRAQPGGGRGARRGAARVLRLGSAAPGHLRQRQQGPRTPSWPSSCPSPTPRYAARNASERSGDALPIAERFGAAGQARGGLRLRRGGARCRGRRGRRRRSHPRDGLSVHCRGRAPGARFPRRSMTRRIDPAHRQARRRPPRSGRRGAASRRGQGPRDRGVGPARHRARASPRSTTASIATSRSSASSSTSSPAARWSWRRSPARMPSCAGGR